MITDGVASHFMTDPVGLGNLVGEYDENGDLTHRYTHGLGLLAKGNIFYTFDGNGNTSELTDGAAEIVNYYVYTPFGETLYDVENTENDFEFVGQFGVRKMGDDLTYMRNRFYMPSTGRFYSEDPIGLAGGDIGFYRYVGNDPVNFVDPWGLQLSFSQQMIVSATTTATATIGFAIGGTAGSTIAGGITGYLVTAMMDGATAEDKKNNALSGALSGASGGLFGELLKASLMHPLRAAAASGVFAGLIDSALMMSDQFFTTESCD